ncbi:MAG TPA: response regulator transcription factor [Planctomycetaceae bacterium]|nr:response regulator transcription factor [Planctomycetaceae bacterium]
MRILIVEDEEPLALGLKFNFEQEGYEVILAGDGPTALTHFKDETKPFDVVILDLMLPGMSGYETCKAIRAIDELVPILTLSARSLSEDRTLAFDAGTDQYMTKPFKLPELLSRVRNLLSRAARTGQAAKTSVATAPHATFDFNSVHVDFDKFEVTVAGKTQSLTTQEMQLLRYFITHEGRVLSRFDILEDVWEHNPDVTVRTIDNFVLRLRRIIETNPAEPRHILSIRGTGYRFVAQPAGDSGSTPG